MTQILKFYYKLIKCQETRKQSHKFISYLVSSFIPQLLQKDESYCKVLEWSLKLCKRYSKAN